MQSSDGNDDDDDDDEEGVDESEIEKQMGDVGDTGEEEKLDEKMWGDDEHEEDDDNPEVSLKVERSRLPFSVRADVTIRDIEMASHDRFDYAFIKPHD